MEVGLKETIDNKFKDLVKLVVLGFIAFDFFNPLTFKYIVTLFEKAETRMNLFISFKILYLTLPVFCYVVFLIFSDRIDELKAVPTKKFRNGYNVALTSILIIVVLVAILITAPIGSTGNGYIESIVMIVLCCGFAVGYWLFSRVHVNDVKPLPKKTWPGSSKVLLALTITVSGIIFLCYSDENDEAMSVQDIYYYPFESQAELERNEKNLKRFYDLEQEVNRELSKGILLVKTYGNDFNVRNSRTLGEVDDSFFKIAQSDTISFSTITLANKAKASITNRIEKLQHPNVTSEELKDLNRQLQVVPEFMSFTRHTLEEKMNKEQGKTIKQAKTLLTHVQKADLLILPVLIFCLFVLYELRVLTDSQSETKVHLKAVIVIYVLMFVQMLKPVNPNHINLHDASWPFTYSNWYLPGYIQNIGSLSNQTVNNDNSVTVQAEIGELQEEIILLKSQNLQLTQNLIVLNNHLQGNCLTAGALNKLQGLVGDANSKLGTMQGDLTTVKNNTTIRPN